MQRADLSDLVSRWVLQTSPMTRAPRTAARQCRRARGRQQPGRTAEPTPPVTAQRRSPPRAVPGAGPCGASTRAQPSPREPGDAALARAGRDRNLRPEPRAGPGLEAVGLLPRKEIQKGC